MIVYTVQDKKGKVVFESDALETCLRFCRGTPPPLKVFKGKTLLAYKKGSSSSSGSNSNTYCKAGRGRPRKNLELLDVD